MTCNRILFPLLLYLQVQNKEVTLKACSGCNSVCYSDKEAQKQDWKQHKGLCKAIQPLGEYKGIQIE